MASFAPRSLVEYMLVHMVHRGVDIPRPFMELEDFTQPWEVHPMNVAIPDGNGR